MVFVSARFRLVEDGAYAAPGTCLICKRADDERGMTDTQTDLDWVGAVYICSYCVLEMAEQYGAASPQTQLINLATSESRDRELEAASERLQKAEVILNALGAAHLLDMSYDDMRDLVHGVSEEPPSLGEADVDDSAEPGEGEQPATDERVDSQGPDDFFGSDGPDDEITIDL